MVTFHHTETICPVVEIVGAIVSVQLRCGVGGVTVTVVEHDVPLRPFAHSTFIVYVVVLVGASVADPFRVGEVNPVNPARLGVNVGFCPLVYAALIVTVCPAWIVEALGVSVHEAHNVGHDHNPVQSALQ